MAVIRSASKYRTVLEFKFVWVGQKSVVIGISYLRNVLLFVISTTIIILNVQQFFTTLFSNKKKVNVETLYLAEIHTTLPAFS